ncbi:hypothetical protein NQ317_013025 [Molorchus minor]|uniref:PDZ domain-containing protein n=1 Tax=Molorchus minor TaxID=1323400 RepID=A0ABQ9K2G7_9CUCU|nr:hypothetical protein NQ317_013025 [Molorchus minor]
MSLYPSLEDMKVDQMCRAQISQMACDAPPPYPISVPKNMPIPSNGAASEKAVLYPFLGEYMGLELSESVIAENMPEYSQLVIATVQQSDLIPTGTNSALIAPVSGQSLGLQRAQVTHGVREVILCKDKDSKVVVRDRPFERTITLHKDSAGGIGFQFKNGKITSIVKDSSAARNGVLTDHQLLEVDGQNVVGLKDKQICSIIEKATPVVTITVIPSFMYEHMVKKMAGSLLKELMDHSIPTL